MFQIKYCVASLDIRGGVPHVSFYAYRPETQYLFHKVGDWDDPFVQWYDTEAEALKARWNANDCVVSRGFENGKGC